MLGATDDRGTDCLAEALLEAWRRAGGVAKAWEERDAGVDGALLLDIPELLVEFWRRDEGALFPLGFWYHLRAISL